MKKMLSFILCVTLYAGIAFAQAPKQNASHDIVLTINSYDGNNGLAVAYNAKLNLYYSIFAGNQDYPIEVHDGSGRSVFSTSIGADVRGMWFNDKKNQLEGILYDNKGSFVMKLDGSGYPKPVETSGASYGMESQCVAAFFKGNVYFVNDYGYLFKFKQGQKKSKEVKITDAYTEWFSLNTYGVFHTGKKGYEIGLFNFINNTVVLFNEKTGNVGAIVNLDLPSDMESPDSFKVSYCNNRVFLYDGYERKWYGFKIF